MKLISQAVKKFFDLNEVPDGLWSQVSDEAYFSKSECEVCKTNLHGNRFDVEFVVLPDDRDYGLRDFMIKDPQGDVLTLSEPIAK